MKVGKNTAGIGLSLESTLNTVSGNGHVSGPFYGYAGPLGKVLARYSTKPRTLERALVKMINYIITDEGWQKPSMTIEEYAKWRGFSEFYVRKLCRTKKLIAVKVKNKWVIS